MGLATLWVVTISLPAKVNEEQTPQWTCNFEIAMNSSQFRIVFIKTGGNPIVQIYMWDSISQQESLVSDTQLPVGSGIRFTLAPGGTELLFSSEYDFPVELQGVIVQPRSYPPVTRLYQFNITEQILNKREVTTQPEWVRNKI